MTAGAHKRRLISISVALALFALPLSLGGVTLSWTDNSNNETGFRIERAASDLVFAPLATVDRNITTYSDATAADGTVYYYRVAAVNSSGLSAYSNVADTSGGGQPSPANTTPTISDLSNQSMGQGTTLGPLAVMVGDAETPANALTVTATSSNAALVPTLTLGGSGANRTLTLTAASDQTGTATITVSVSDGEASASDTFQLTVAATNTAPTISALAAQTVNEDGSTGALAFTVGDAETTAADLVVSGNSSNTTLFPVANIVFGGSGANRTVTLNPAANQSGAATITLTVSDGSLTATQTFNVTVNPVNDGPTLAPISNQTGTAGTAMPPISLTVGDIDTPVANLTLSGSSSNATLVPNSGLQFGGADGNRTLTINPAAGQSGTATITVVVSDGSLTATRQFTVVINAAAPNTAPTISSVAPIRLAQGDSTGTIAFTVSDAETNANLLTVTARTNNSNLVPPDGIVLGGTGANRTVAITPRNRTGVATVTLTVSDGIASASTSFLLTVVQGIPLLSGANPLAMNSERAASVEDSQTAAASAPRVSVLGPVATGAPLVAGLVVEGDAARDVLVRAIGPGLSALGLVQPVAMPHLVIYNAAGEPVHESDAWNGNAAISDASARAGFVPLAANSADAAAVVTLRPGFYNVHVVDAHAAPGTAMIEIADVAPGPNLLVRVQSARARISQGTALTAGVLVDDAAPARLRLYGASSVPTDSALVIRDHSGTEVAKTADAVGVSLAPGAYTVTLTGQNAEGEALIELNQGR